MKKKKAVSKALSLFLAVVMVLCSVPSVFAADLTHTAQAVRDVEGVSSQREEPKLKRFENETQPTEEERTAAAQEVSLSRSVTASDDVYQKVLRENVALQNSHRTDAAAMAAYSTLAYTESTLSGEQHTVSDYSSDISAFVTQALNDWVAMNSGYTVAGLTDSQKAQAVYYFVCDRLYYNYDISENRVVRTSQSAATMVNGIKSNSGIYVAVCEGYARLYRAMMRSLGIPCVYIEGYANSNWSANTQSDDEFIYKNYINHAWNEVYFDGAWHLVDCTWGSGNTYNYVAGEGLYGGNVSYSWFDISAETFARSHRANYYEDENLGSYVNDSTSSYDCGTYDASSGVFTFNSGDVYIYCEMFSGLSSLKKVVLQADTNVIAIGANAFNGCVNFTGFNRALPKGIEYIAANAFEECYSVTAFDIEDGGAYYKSLNSNSIFTADNKALLFVASNATNTVLDIPEGAEYIDIISTIYSMTITEVNIPSTMTAIDTVGYMGYLFYDWIKLEQINVASSNAGFASVDGVLYDKGLSTLVKFPDSCSRQTVNIPSTVTAIKKNAVRTPAFSQTLEIVNISSANSAFTSVDGVLYSKDMKTIIILPPKSTAENVYYYDNDGVLTQSETAKSINPAYYYPYDYPLENDSDYAIRFKLSLTSLILDNVVTVDRWAMADTSIKEIYAPNVTEINSCAFLAADGLEYVEIPNVTTIGNGALCTYTLKNLALPSALSNIAEGAYSTISNYTQGDGGSVSWSYSVVGCKIYSSTNAQVRSLLGGYAYTFADAPAIGIDLPQNVSYIQGDELPTLSVRVYGFNMTYQWYRSNDGTVNSASAVSGATSRTYTPDNLKSGDNYFFVKIKSKDGTDTAVSLNSGVVDVNTTLTSGFCGARISYSFDRATGELTITGSGSMNDFASASAAPWYVFMTEITKITVNGNVTDIGDYAFSGAVNLQSVTLPASVEEIGVSAFEGDSSLTAIDLSNVKVIGTNAFKDCSSLGDTIVLPADFSSIGDGAFENCTSLVSVVILSESVSVSGNPFDGCSSSMILKYRTAAHNEFSSVTNVVRQLLPENTKLGIVAYHSDGVQEMTMADAMAAFNYVADGDSSAVYCFAAIDVDGNGEYTLCDVLTMLLGIKNGKTDFGTI